MNENTLTWIVRVLIVAVPIVVLTIRSLYVSVATNTFERTAIRRGKLLSWTALWLAAIHPAYLWFEPIAVDTPSYFFASAWICAVLSVLAAPRLAIAEIEASRRKWRSPRFAELSKARSEEVELDYLDWRRRLVRSVVRGEVPVSILRGVARRVVKADLADAEEAEEKRQERAEEREHQRRIEAERSGRRSNRKRDSIR